MVARELASDAECPCQSGLAYQQCCASFHQGSEFPQTPEALMRSRYSAYALANIHYIQQTMQGKAARGFDPVDAVSQGESAQWCGLSIVKSEIINPERGVVEFVAQYRVVTDANADMDILHEISEFKRIDGRWFYVDGKPGKFKSNEPCFCGSGKKFKKCCRGSA